MIGLGVLGLRPGLPYVLLVQFSGLIGELAGQESTERRGDYETILATAQSGRGIILGWQQVFTVGCWHCKDSPLISPVFAWSLLPPFCTLNMCCLHRARGSRGHCRAVRDIYRRMPSLQGLTIFNFLIKYIYFYYTKHYIQYTDYNR